MSDQEGKHRGAQGEVDQVAGKPVCCLLYRRPGALCILDCLDDLAESRRFFSQTLRAHLERSRLVDGSRVDIASRRLFTGHRFAGDCGLLHKRMTTENPAVHGDSAAGPYDNHFSGQNGFRVHFDDLILSEHARGLGKKVQHVLDGAAPATDSEPFEDLRCEDECGDDKRGEKLANRQRGNKGDGHGEFHRHAALKNVLECLLEDGVAPDQRRHQPNTLTR